ncbi:MAG: hypothetical protein AAF797_05305 [Planctomycetota bacterium]
MNDKDWDDYLRQQPGTFWGDFAAKHQRMFQDRITESYQNTAKVNNNAEPVEPWTGEQISGFLGASAALSCSLFWFPYHLVDNWFWPVLSALTSATFGAWLFYGPLYPAVRLMAWLLSMIFVSVVVLVIGVLLVGIAYLAIFNQTGSLHHSP